MKNEDKMMLGLMVWGFAIVLCFGSVVAFAGNDESCEVKADKAHKLCQEQLGKVHICEDAYLRTLLTCQINKG